MHTGIIYDATTHINIPNKIKTESGLLSKFVVRSP